jgi:SNF2 family DNA or RNA helicase
MQIELFKPSAKPWKPHLYQKKAVKFLLEHGAAGLLLSPGLGKSSITLAAIKLLIKAKVASKILVIAPLRVAHSTWPGEATKWLDFKDLKMVVLHGPDKEALLKSEADIYVINPEGLDWLLGVTKTKSIRTGKNTVTADVKKFKKLDFDTLVIDELTKFKNHSSDRFKAMKQVLHLFKRRWGLTGSPAANGLLQLFGQMYMLDQGNALGQYVMHYQKTYFTPAWNGFGWDIKPGGEDQIYEKISPLCLRMAAEDYLDMPQLIENIIRVEMPEKAFLQYLNMENNLVAQMDSGKVTAKTAGVSMGKCRQMASGAVFLTPEVTGLLKPPKTKRDWAEIHTVKIEALEDLIEELQGSPLLVAYEFEHDMERLRKAFPTAVFASDYQAKDFKKLEDKWNRGEIEVLFGQPQGLSHGLNLQEAGYHVAWFTLTWDGEIYEQFIKRVLRQGNKSKKVFVHVILCDNTVDLVVWNSLHTKEKVQQNLFDGLEKLSKSRRQRS